jgi:signal transduction histidine kinase
MNNEYPFSVYLRRMPLRAAFFALTLLFPASAFFASFVGAEVNRILAAQTVDALRNELGFFKSEFDRGGVEAVSEAVQSRSIGSTYTLYQLTRLDQKTSIGNLKGSFSDIGEKGQVFELSNALPNGGAEKAAGIAITVPGGGRLLLARRIDDQRQFADYLRNATFAGVSLLGSIALMMGWIASRRVNSRVAKITLTAHSIMGGDFSRRIARDHSGDEFDELASNLNAMLTRIEDLMGALREVSDNIAHDLKTPLTRLRNRAEAALRDDSPAAHREGLERVIEEADGLIQTFNALLLIARLEAGAVDATRTPCNVSALVDDVIELYQPVANDANLQIISHVGSALALAVNRQLVGQAVANMLDNAIKYSPAEYGAAQGPIEVSVSQGLNGLEIAVGDRGPGIAAVDRDRATKRFVRLERSRSRPGTGLGLSLVAAVARLHGGALRLEDNEPGLRIVLTLGGPRSTLNPKVLGEIDRVESSATDSR